VVGQALRDGLSSQEQIATYVDQLRRGEAVFADELGLGRAKSLGASLSYGFAYSFSEVERRQLPLLHFFQGFVDVRVLMAMGTDQAKWGLPALRGLTREQGVALLDRAAEVGLLTALGSGYYRIHPALPWYFRQLYEEYYGAADQGLGVEEGIPQSPAPSPQLPARAFVEAMGKLGDYYHRQYHEGNRDVIGVLGAEEANLRHARRLARRHGWWEAVTSTMQRLRHLYSHTGRRIEWARLVAEIVPDFVAPATDGPLPGREAQWSLVTQYRVHLAREARQWAELLPHLNAALNYCQQALALLPANVVDDLAVTHNQLGNIYFEAGQTARALAHYQQSINYKEKAGNIYAAGTTRYNVAVMLYQQNRLADARAYAEAALRNFQVYGPRAAAEIELTQRLLEDINR
jgi:tetratricopeptide (TPR) repeat protein